jgi:hypothetical protein
MKEFNFGNLPSISKVLKNKKILADMKNTLPDLQAAGITDIELKRFEDLINNLEAIVRVLDQFNNLFSSRGWIVYDSMSHELAKAAVEKAEAGKIEEAEIDLIDYYSAETISLKIVGMKKISAFRPRVALTKKALTDYKEERYHACIPVVLLLIDGLITSIYEKYRGKRLGFSAKEVDLTAWDSLAGHNSGLNELCRIFHIGRYAVTTEQITIPYRNGILHGMDLGYDNKIVAAKTWAALFAVGEWASKAEKNELDAQPEELELSVNEVASKLLEIQAMKEECERDCENWIRREIEIGKEVPETGEPADFCDNSPEKKLVEFLTFWRSKNYGGMAQCFDPMDGEKARKNPGKVREIYVEIEFQFFSLTKIYDKGPGMTFVDSNLSFTRDGKMYHKEVEYLLVNTSEDGTLQARGKLGSSWRVMNWDSYVY